MKKSILTIAFLSFAFVATSFTTLDASNNLTMDPPPTGGQCVGCETKKQDFAAIDYSVNTNSIHQKGFVSDSQSLENTKKLD